MTENVRHITVFSGTYSAKIDAHYRFLLPADVKKHLPDGNQTELRLMMGMDDTALYLYTLASIQPIYERISLLDEFEPEERKFKEQYLGAIHKVELDAAGKLVIPRPLYEKAKLDKEIDIIGSGDKWVIRDKALNESMATTYTPQVMNELAKKLLSKKNPPSTT